VNDDLTFISGSCTGGQGTVDLQSLLAACKMRRCRTAKTHLVQVIDLNELDRNVIVILGDSNSEFHSVTDIGECNIDDVLNLLSTPSALLFICGLVELLLSVSKEAMSDQCEAEVLGNPFTKLTSKDC
jgi:hypothetical protein